MLYINSNKIHLSGKEKQVNCALGHSVTLWSVYSHEDSLFEASHSLHIMEERMDNSRNFELSQGQHIQRILSSFVNVRLTCMCLQGTEIRSLRALLCIFVILCHNRKQVVSSRIDIFLKNIQLTSSSNLYYRFKNEHNLWLKHEINNQIMYLLILSSKNLLQAKGT